MQFYGCDFGCELICLFSRIVLLLFSRKGREIILIQFELCPLPLLLLSLTSKSPSKPSLPSRRRRCCCHGDLSRRLRQQRLHPRRRALSHLSRVVQTHPTTPLDGRRAEPEVVLGSERRPPPPHARLQPRARSLSTRWVSRLVSPSTREGAAGQASARGSSFRLSLVSLLSPSLAVGAKEGDGERERKTEYFPFFLSSPSCLLRLLRRRRKRGKD